MASPFFPRKINRKVNLPSDNPSSIKSQIANFSSFLYSSSLSSTKTIHLEGLSPSPYSSVQSPKFSLTVTMPRILMPVSVILSPSLGLVICRSGWASLAVHSLLGAKVIFLGYSCDSNHFFPSLVFNHLRAHSSSTRITWSSSVNSSQASEASSRVHVSSVILRHKSMPGGRGS